MVTIRRAPGRAERSISQRLRAPAALLGIATAVALLGGGQVSVADPPPPPNVIFLLTDDQTMEEMAGLPQTTALIGDQGISFDRSYITFPLCCPSRATFFTGQYMHNHKVRGNSPPYGGVTRFVSQGDETHTVPIWLQGDGYYTGHVGKYLNGFADESSPETQPYVPAGWDEFYAKMGSTAGLPSENSFFNYSLYEKGPTLSPQEIVYNGPDTYQTDVYRDLAVDFIERRAPMSQPFYLSVSFGAPHGPYQPAPRDLGGAAGTPLRKGLGFNELNMTDKPRWLQERARKLHKPDLSAIAKAQRRRLEQLHSVDEAIAAIVAALENSGDLANTYIEFTSDNGFFFGEHRIASGKYLPYEPSSHVPLMIRGPGIPIGSSSDELVGNTDFAPTVLSMAGVSAPSGSDIDGRSMLPYAESPSLRSTRPILLEADIGPGKGTDGRGTDLLGNKRGPIGLDQERIVNLSKKFNGTRAPAYRALRTSRYLYVIYNTGDEELYDMDKDPGQQHSLQKARRYQGVREWLFDALVNRINCKQAACRVELGPDPKPDK